MQALYILTIYTCIKKGRFREGANLTFQKRILGRDRRDLVKEGAKVVFKGRLLRRGYVNFVQGYQKNYKKTIYT